MMKLKLILGILFWTATLQVCRAQSIARGYSETHQLEELKTWDAQGKMTFQKWCLSDNHFEMQAWAYDASGKPERMWEVLWRTDALIVREMRYFQDRTETWMPRQDARLSADPELAQAISQFKRDGLPSTREELIGYPAIRKILDGDRYCAEINELNAAGLPLKTTYFDVNGEKTGEEKSIYDAQGHCTWFIVQEMDEEGTYLESHLKYNAQGKVTQVVQLESEGGETDTVLVSRYSYQDTLLKERIDLEGGMHSPRWTNTTLSYDSKHRIIRDEITDSKTAGPLTYKTFSYDGKGRMAKEEWFRREKKTLQKIRSVTWAYE